MRSAEFWDYFDRMIKPELGARAETFAQMFSYLDQFDRAIGIVETGCLRQAGNWTGDGGSTLLFDTYAKFHAGTAVYSVDLDAQAVALCRGLVSPLVKVHQGDSVAFLKKLADRPPTDLPFLDLLYLDSYDLDFANPVPSGVHHLKELAAIGALLHRKTLVVVDDSPTVMTGFYDKTGKFSMVNQASIGGKGQYVAEYAEQIGAQKIFSSYQCGWTGFGK